MLELLESRMLFASLYEIQMQDIVNQDRQAAKVQQLRWSDKLYNVATIGPDDNHFNIAIINNYIPVIEYQVSDIDTNPDSNPTNSLHKLNSEFIDDATILFPYATDIGISVKVNPTNVTVIIDIGRKLGDANGDSNVDSRDFTIMAQNFNQEKLGFDFGDFNFDNKINALDFNSLAIGYGN